MGGFEGEPSDPSGGNMPEGNKQIHGLIKWFSSEKGYGFIQADGINKDIFLHVKQLRSSGIMGNLNDGEHVLFVCNDGPKGLFATNIARTNGGVNANQGNVA